MRKLLLAAAALVSVPATAAPVDLSTWTSETVNGSGANWTVNSGANPNDSVFQSVNGNPTVFFEPGANAQGQSLSGTITVETTGDDDFIGFVLGYDSGDINSATSEFVLIDWKQGDQAPAVDGLALSIVRGDSRTTGVDDYWEHSGVVTEIARANTLGSTGWLDNTTYTFDLTFQPTLITVLVDGILELSVTSAQVGAVLGEPGFQFENGSFGFYNYSQGFVRYAGITQDIAPPPPPTGVPAPGAIALLGLGVAGIAGMRRRRTA